jgi:hypothetical protein
MLLSWAAKNGVDSASAVYCLVRAAGARTATYTAVAKTNLRNCHSHSSLLRAVSNFRTTATAANTECVAILSSY